MTLSAIYSQTKDSESSFLSNVQNILHSLHDLESTMPGEYFMDFRESSLIIAGRPFPESLTQIARTSASLYLSIYLVSGI
jgi:proline utilization trans-activator